MAQQVWQDLPVLPVQKVTLVYGVRPDRLARYQLLLARRVPLAWLAPPVRPARLVQLALEQGHKVQLACKVYRVQLALLAPKVLQDPQVQRELKALLEQAVVLKVQSDRLAQQVQLDRLVLLGRRVLLERHQPFQDRPVQLAR